MTPERLEEIRRMARNGIGVYAAACRDLLSHIDSLSSWRPIEECGASDWVPLLGWVAAWNCLQVVFRVEGQWYIAARLEGRMKVPPVTHYIPGALPKFAPPSHKGGTR